MTSPVRARFAMGGSDHRSSLSRRRSEWPARMRRPRSDAAGGIDTLAAATTGGGAPWTCDLSNERDSHRLPGPGRGRLAAVCSRRESAGRHFSSRCRSAPIRQNQFTVRFDHHINDHAKLQLLLLLHRRYDFSRSTTSRRPARTFRVLAPTSARVPAIQPQPYLDDQQRPGERGPLHLYARRPADLSSIRRRTNAVQHPARPGAKLCASTALPTRSAVIHESISARAANLGITTGLARESHRRSVRRRWRRLRYRQRLGRRTCRKSATLSVGRQLDLGERQSHHEVWRGCPPRPLRSDSLLQRERRLYLRQQRPQRDVPASDNYAGLSSGPCRQLYARFGAAENVRNTVSICLRRTAGRSSLPDPELRPALGTGYALTDISHHVQTFRPGRTRLCILASLTPAEQIAESWSAIRLRQYGCCTHGPGGPRRQRRSGRPDQTYYKAFAPRIGLA